MADHTKIEWTDATWNPITGCSVVSPGCTNCYAMRLAGTRMKNEPSRSGLTIDTKAGPVWNGTLRINTDWLDLPLRWKKPRRIFVGAHTDLFHEKMVPCVLDEIFARMALAPWHTFQVLTKRPAIMQDYLLSRGADFTKITNAAHRIMQGRSHKVLGYGLPATMPLPNVWLGISIEDQKRADERVPILLDTPAAVRWVSAEPLLGRIEFHNLPGGPGVRINALTGERLYAYGGGEGDYDPDGTRLDWVVAGGESGPGARPMHPDWARSLRDQCAAAGVQFLFKQWGEYGAGSTRISTGEQVFRQFATFDQWVNKARTWVNGGICLDAKGRRIEIGADMHRARDEGAFPVTVMHKLGKKAAGRSLDGVTHDAYPEVAA